MKNLPELKFIKWLILIFLSFTILSCSNNKNKETGHTPYVEKSKINSNESIAGNINSVDLDNSSEEKRSESIFIKTNDGVFTLDDFQIESSSHLESTTSKKTTSWRYTDSEILGSDWYYLLDGDYHLKSAKNDGKRTEFKELKGIESSLNTFKKLKYEASISNIPENGVTIAQVHNRFKESKEYRTRRPLIRIYIEGGKINIKKTNNDLTFKKGEYDQKTIGPSITENSKFKVQLTISDGKVNIKIETPDETLEKDFTPNTTVDAWSDYQNYFYLKAGVYTEGNDTEPVIRFYSFEKE